MFFFWYNLSWTGPHCWLSVLFAQQKKQENKAPDKDAILKATANLTTRNTDRTVTQHNIRDVRFLRGEIKSTALQISKIQ